MILFRDLQCTEFQTFHLSGVTNNIMSKHTLKTRPARFLFLVSLSLSRTPSMYLDADYGPH